VRIDAGFGRGAGDAAHDGADQPGRFELVLAEQHNVMVDAALRVRVEAARIQVREALGVTPGVQDTIRPGVDTRGQKGRAVEQQRPWLLTVTANHSYRVRAAEINRKPDP
jgi:hypothetical protein